MRASLLAALAAALLCLAGPVLAGKPVPSTAKSKSRPAPTAPTKVLPPMPMPVPVPVPPPPAPVEVVNQPLRPNLFEVKSGTLSVTWSTSGIDGKPHFNYQDSGVTISASDAQIRTQETEIGTLVSITIRRTIDTGSAAFSLLVPQVNLDPANPVATVNLVGITTNRRFSPVPMMNRGQIQLGSAVILNGTARRVAF